MSRQELCLIETSFPCASAEYSYGSRECRLSRESRRSQPGAYRATTADTDYIENQCVATAAAEAGPSCQYERYEDQDIGYADIQVAAASAEEVNICSLENYILVYMFLSRELVDKV